jgi:O-antigen/teichoic acid export membrane protein
MTLSGLLEIIYRNIYVLIIGKNYTATQLGFYSRADSISQLPTNNIFNAINSVTYPMFATISEDNIRLKMVYKKLVQQVLFWNASILILLVVIAEPLFRFLLTEKWLPAVPYFQILCLAGILYPLHAYNHNILKVKGRSDLILKIEFVKKAAAVLGILLIIPFGIFGLLYFQLAFSIISCFINSYYSGILINYSIKEQLVDIFPAILLSILTGLICFFLDLVLQPIAHFSDLERLIINSLLFYTLYMSSSYFMQFNAVTDFKQLILKR